jgi:helix-turn-helix protein
MSAHPSNAAGGDHFTRAKFAWLTQVAADNTLSGVAVRVAIRLVEHLNRETFEAFPSQARLAQDVGASVRGVGKGIDQLVKRGHLVTRRGSVRTVNRYRLILRATGTIVPDAEAPGRNNRASQTGTVVPLRPEQSFLQNPLKQPNERTPISRREGTLAAGSQRDGQRSVKEFEAEFPEWYAKYPRQMSEGAARKAYVSARKKGATPAEMMAGVLRYAAAWQGRDPQYIKAPARWLTEECWRDNPTAHSRQLSDREEKLRRQRWL